MTAHTPTIFESFNARALKPSQVAKTFVPSQHFDQLAKRNHAIVVGPRGSGKTTLLKMLQQPALEAWEHPKADMYRTRIDYTGVFIATDLSWGAQVESLGEGKLDPVSHKLLSRAAFTTHVLRSLVIAMLHRLGTMANGKYPFRRVQISNEKEADLVRTLSQAWNIQPAIPSLLSLKQSLSIRLSLIREVASSEVTLGEDGRNQRLGSIRFLHTHFIEDASIATESFNDLVGDEDGKWALMFDELEVAPEWIQDELIRSLRSTDAKFLYKLAMSPYSYSARLLELKTGKAPSVGQDFEQIPLWYVEKHQSYEFCYHLWDSMLKEREIEPKEPTKVLGRSYFETYPDEWIGKGTAYGPESKISHRFISLANNDATFRSYLVEKGIDPTKLHNITKPVMDSVVRKMAPLIAIREYYRAPDGKREREITLRTRKSAILYAGAESLFAISEGNPRWFIAIVGKLLDNWQDKSKRIQRGAQAKEMIKAGQRFAAMLRTIPSPPSRLLGQKLGILSLIQLIATYFHNQVVVEDFIAEPPSTFYVDQTTSGDIISMLEQALNAGALVYIPDDDSQIILSSLMVKRFRISYLLAPLNGLPLRLGSDVSLTHILKASSNKPLDLMELPFEEGDDDE